MRKKDLTSQKKKQRIVTLTVHNDGEDLTIRAINDWQEEGVLAIWKAMRELTILSYKLRGEALSPNIERNKFEMRTVPWLDCKNNNKALEDA